MVFHLWLSFQLIWFTMQCLTFAQHWNTGACKTCHIKFWSISIVSYLLKLFWTFYCISWSWPRLNALIFVEKMLKFILVLICVVISILPRLIYLLYKIIFDKDELQKYREDNKIQTSSCLNKNLWILQIASDLKLIYETKAKYLWWWKTFYDNAAMAAHV